MATWDLDPNTVEGAEARLRWLTADLRFAQSHGLPGVQRLLLESCMTLDKLNALRSAAPVSPVAHEEDNHG